MFLKAEFDWVPDVTVPRFYFLDVDRTSINVTISLGCGIFADCTLYCGFKNVIFNVQNPEKWRFFFHFFKNYPFIRTLFFNNNRVLKVNLGSKRSSSTAKVHGFRTLRVHNPPGSDSACTAYSVMFQNQAI